MNMKKLMIVPISLLMLAFSLDASRRGMRQRMDGWGDGTGTRMLRIMETRAASLGITEQQMKEIRSLCSANAEKNVALTNKNNLLRVELNQLMLADTPDYTKIRALMSQMGENRIERRLNGMKHREKVMNILTPEQRKLIGDGFGMRMYRRGDRWDTGTMRGNRKPNGRRGGLGS